LSLFSSSSPPILFILSCSAKLHNMVRYKPQKVTKRKRTKRRTKDLDQIWDELHNPHQNTQLKKIIRKKNVKMDLPGFGKFYCAVCEYVSLSLSLSLTHRNLLFTLQKRKQVHFIILTSFLLFFSFLRQSLFCECSGEGRS
jgi:hypothetical protein